MLDTAQFGNDLGFLAHGVGAVPMAAALTKEKIGFWHVVPYLLARQGDAEVMRRWTRAAEEDHHPVASECLSDPSPPKPLILRMPSGASELSAPLQAEVDSLGEFPIDGSVADGAPRWPFISSTMRLDQSLADAHALQSKIVCGVQVLWNNWNSVTREEPSFARGEPAFSVSP